HPALVVRREIHWPDHAIAATFSQPRLSGREQRAGGFGIVLALEEPEYSPLVVLELVEVAVDVGGDPPHHATVPPGQEVLGLRVHEEWVPLAVEEALSLEQQRGNPVGLVTIQPPRQLDERVQVAPARDGPNV